MDFLDFTTGELEIITSSYISESEGQARLEFLNLLSHLLHGYPWEMVHSIYAEMVSQIEKGSLAWEEMGSGRFQEKIQWVIMKNFHKISKGISDAGSSAKSRNLQKHSNSSEGANVVEGTFYCKPFQKERCELKDPHVSKIGTESVIVQHICGKCWIDDKAKRFHSLSSLECPYFNSKKD